jgi:hypothetical protein
MTLYCEEKYISEEISTEHEKGKKVMNMSNNCLNPSRRRAYKFKENQKER